MSEQLAQMRHRQKTTDDMVSTVINGMKTFGWVLNTIWPNVGGEAGPRQTMQFPFATPAPSPPLSVISPNSTKSSPNLGLPRSTSEPSDYLVHPRSPDLGHISDYLDHL